MKLEKEGNDKTWIQAMTGFILLVNLSSEDPTGL